MNTDALLTLTQWLSPGFPISAYAYSHGLEQVIDAGAVSGIDDLRIWLEDILEHGAGLNDAILLVSAYHATSDQLTSVETTARAFAASRERLTESIDQGHAFVRTVNAVWGLALEPLCYPVAVGAAAREQKLPLESTLQIFVHAFVANLVSAAVRLVPLGQTDGQALLAQLAPRIQDTAKKAQASTLEDLASACFALDIASMKHETQYSKVFRT